MPPLSWNRSARSTLFDLVPWDAFVAEGVLRQVDGAFLGALRFRGPDLDSVTPEELEALEATLAKALRLLGDGWVVHLDVLRRPAPGYPEPGAFPDPFSQALDEERRRAYQAAGRHFRSEQTLSITHRPRRDGGLGAKLWGAAPPSSDDQERALEDFEARLNEITQLLSTQMVVHRLGSKGLLTHLYRCLTGRFQPLGVPNHPFPLEAILGSGDLVAGLEVRFSETHFVPVAITGFPDSTTPAALDFLHRLAFPFRASFRYLPLDPYTARRAIEAKRTRWVSAGVTIKDILSRIVTRPDQGAAFEERFAPAMAKDADQALLTLERTQQGAGHATLVVLVFDPDRDLAAKRAATVVRELRNRGFAAWIEEMNAAEAFLGTLPGCGAFNVRRPILLARNFLDLALVTSVWPGEPRHPHPVLAGQPAHVIASTAGSTPFHCNLSHHDVQHGLIIGPTGAGKSVLLGLLMLQYLRYPDSQVFAFDKGWSLLAATHAAQGCHYPLSTDTETGEQQATQTLRFAPLARLDTRADRQRALEWLEDLIRLQGVPPSPDQRLLLQRSVELLATTRHRTLTQLAAKLQDAQLRGALRPYGSAGPYGYLFDGDEDTLAAGRLHVFEMEDVLPLRAQAVVPLVLHLFAEIEARLDGRPTLILVEEALGYLGDTLWAERLTRWLYELRKKNCGVVFVSQTLTALLESSLKTAILESCPSRIYLPNPGANEEASTASYRAFGLNRRQINLVAQATPRRDYYMTSPAGARLFQLDLSLGALAILGLAGPEARREIARARTSRGPAWVASFLEERQAGELARLVRRFSRAPVSPPTEPQEVTP